MVRGSELSPPLLPNLSPVCFDPIFVLRAPGSDQCCCPLLVVSAASQVGDQGASSPNPVLDLGPAVQFWLLVLVLLFASRGLVS